MKRILTLLSIFACNAFAQTSQVNGKGDGITNPDFRASVFDGSGVSESEFVYLDGLQNIVEAKAPLVDGLANYRKSVAVNNFTRTSVLIFGDSMIGGATQKFRLANSAYLGETDMAWADGGVSGGAVVEYDACVKWLTGQTYALSGSGHTATFGNSVSFGISGNTLKIYYLKQSGGGVFKVQSEKNQSGTWSDEAGYTAVDTSNASNAASVITITKSDYRANWRVRCVWVSGGLVNIIGAGVVDTARYGAKCAIMTNGSTSINNIDNAATTAAAIVNPVLADLAPQLVILGHLDGAAMVNSSQASFQNVVNTGITSAGAAAPSWIVVGPPSGYDSTTDTNNAAQAAAQKTLAATRDDVFIDRRIWMGGVTAALANGYMTAGDVHPTEKAHAYWIPAMYRQAGIADGLALGPSTRTSFALAGGVDIRTQNNAYNTKNIEIGGNLRLAPPYGATGSGGLFVEDQDGPTNSNDTGYVVYQGNALKFGLSAQARLIVDQPIGQLQLYDASSTASAPNGNLGIVNNPFRAINLGKTINANTTVGDVTVNTAIGRVWFDVGDASITISNTLVTANSYVGATLLGNDATATSVRVETISAGSFVLTLNAAPTAKTAVNFMITP